MPLERELHPPFKTYDKYGFQVELPDMPTGDITGNPVRSRLYLFEDNKLIGKSHHGISAVGAHGGGIFVHWDKVLYFSTPDGSSANDNGRRYKAIWSDELFFEERFQYFHSVLDNTLIHTGLKPHDLKDKNVLEIGCGRQHGMSLIMAGYEANVVAIDRYAPSWDEEFHPGFINYLITHVSGKREGFDGNRLKPFLSTRDFSSSTLSFYPIEAELLTNKTKVKFDLQLSVAALEHFYNIEKVVNVLADTAKPGCISCHCVDFADHRDFGKPLEFLLLSDREYDDLSGDHKYVHGNRVRPEEFDTLWKRGGFKEIKASIVNDMARDDYMRNFLPRLRASGSRFADESEKTLRQLSITYVTSHD